MKKIMITAAVVVIALAACGDSKKTESEPDSMPMVPIVPAEELVAPETVAEADEQPAEGGLKVAVGDVAPDFSLADPSGKQVTLSSLRGKYVVLDFWGTWCGWCVKGIPDMADAYHKYASKMEMLSVDCGDPTEEWKTFVAEKQMDWTNVIDDNEVVMNQYGIDGFPTKIVIDPEGKIVYLIQGEDPAFYSYLDQLLD